MEWMRIKLLFNRFILKHISSVGAVKILCKSGSKEGIIWHGSRQMNAFGLMFTEVQISRISELLLVCG
jgi:hypothetical protein